MNGPGLKSTVLLADDHQMVRQALHRLLGEFSGIEVVATAGNGHEVLDALRRTPVDVVVTDLSLPGLPAMDLIKRIKGGFPRVGVLVLSAQPEDPYAMRALRWGANGYLTKGSSIDQLSLAIRKVAAGGVYVSPTLAERLAMELVRTGDGPRHSQLSDREFEVFRHLAAGHRMTDIARRLHLSIKTVSTHKANLMDKLGLDSTAALVRYSIEEGLDQTRLDGATAMWGEQMPLPLRP